VGGSWSAENRRPDTVLTDYGVVSGRCPPTALRREGRCSRKGKSPVGQDNYPTGARERCVLTPSQSIATLLVFF